MCLCLCLKHINFSLTHANTSIICRHGERGWGVQDGFVRAEINHPPPLPRFHPPPPPLPPRHPPSRFPSPPPPVREPSPHPLPPHRDSHILLLAVSQEGKTQRQISTSHRVTWTPPPLLPPVKYLSSSSQCQMSTSHHRVTWSPQWAHEGKTPRQIPTAHVPLIVRL